MGCVSSKHVKKEIKSEILPDNGGDYTNHVVSLKSSTYGVLQLDRDEELQQQIEEDGFPEIKRVKKSPPREEPEVINALELMEDLDEVKKYGGKENKGSPKSILGVNNSMDSSCKAVLKLSYPVKSTRNEGVQGGDLGFSSRRRVFSPLFDPEVVALHEKESSGVEEQIKMIISPEPETRKLKKSHDSKALLQDFEPKCLAGGENAVVVYTTTLRGIRKTFEECNTVRSIIESYHIQTFERDISMDSGFKEELRKLTGTKEVKVPLVFVKGRLIGGVEEIVKLEEEGKLEILFEGIPMAVPGCKGCGGVRFVMCKQCNGSCKVLDKEQKKIRCGSRRKRKRPASLGNINAFNKKDHLDQALRFCEIVKEETSFEDYLMLLRCLHDYGTGNITMVDLKMKIADHFPSFMDDFDCVLELYHGKMNDVGKKKEEEIDDGKMDDVRKKKADEEIDDRILTESYQVLPEEIARLSCKGATELEKQVLNRTCFCKGSYFTAPAEKSITV
ncbi:hypothetical protein F3Y22_tig00112503pilonHSYRG00321 [Hibiscus syriacus]|uniref:Glutaredoxin domain-containing protein n=1 Tax=Hibiscus syriacus TaxID=106335 RepID=A0A6A2XGK8_HIBSY|nr:hypothetical protein F3Y22_tig00112503pilonHSYRG00321 [Hibiscus syriacus]